MAACRGPILADYDSATRAWVITPPAFAYGTATVHSWRTPPDGEPSPSPTIATEPMSLVWRHPEILLPVDASTVWVKLRDQYSIPVKAQWSHDSWQWSSLTGIWQVDWLACWTWRPITPTPPP